MWSLLDGREMLSEIDPRFGDNIDRHIRRVLQHDLFHVSANTDPKGDRSKRPQDQDPDMMVHVVRETDAGIILRGAKYETAASYADQAFLKPTIPAGAMSSYRIMRSAASSRWTPPGSSTSAARASLAAAVRPTILSPIASMKSTRSSFSTMSSFPGRTCSFTGIRAPPPLFAAPCTVIRRFPMSCAFSIPRSDDRGGAVECKADGARQAAGGAREARRSGLLSRGHQRPSDRRHCRSPTKPGRPDDAASVAALCGPRSRLRQPAANDAHCARAVRRPDLRDPQCGFFCRTGRPRVAADILFAQ